MPTKKRAKRKAPIDDGLKQHTLAEYAKKPTSIELKEIKPTKIKLKEVKPSKIVLKENKSDNV